MRAVKVCHFTSGPRENHSKSLTGYSSEEF